MKVITDTTNSTKLCHASIGDLVKICDTGNFYLVAFMGNYKADLAEQTARNNTEGLYKIAPDILFIDVVTGVRTGLHLSSRCHIIKDAEIVVRTKP